MNTYECDGCGRLMRWGSEGPSPVRQEQDTPQWTTEPPTDPGWYWVRQGHNQPIVAWVRELDRKMRVKLFGNAYHNDVDEKMFTHWMKIEAPEPDAGRS